MVRRVRAGHALRAVAREFGVVVGTVSLWVTRSAGQRLDRASFADRKRGRAWNRVRPAVEQCILQTRTHLREHSVLGEYGADAIERALQEGDSDLRASRATINRVLRRHGATDAHRRTRRPPPPKGWYLPSLAGAHAELDSFDWIEDLKIAGGPLVQVLTGTALWGGEVDAWPQEQISTNGALGALLGRWKRLGLPTYAQFDNDTVFQGAHQFADAVGRVSRLCLALGVIPVFAPPREPGFQNAIESFNGLWQAKVWQRHRFESLEQLVALSACYISAHRARAASRREQAPPRRAFPKPFKPNLAAPLIGTLIFLRRTTDNGHAQLLGRSFEVSRDWQHRLVRCEVDLSAHHIRFYALRRRDPSDQPLLNRLTYHRPHKRYRGET
jgi:transposase